jgi:hypothetical protein
MSDRPYAHIPKEELKKHLENMTGKYGPKEALLAAEIRQKELEEDIKSLKKPHWSLVPIFWIALASLLVSLLAYFRPPKSDVQDAQHTNLISTVSKTSQNSQAKSNTKKPISQHKPVPQKP